MTMVIKAKVIIRILTFLLLTIIILIPPYHISKLDQLPSDTMAMNFEIIQTTNTNLKKSSNKDYNIYQYDRYCSNKSNTSFNRIQIDGLYHTGTNWLYKQLYINCKSRYIWPHPKWHKHFLITTELINKYMPYSKVLSVVLIKHPLAWFRSYCKTWYGLEPYNITWFNEDCPSNIHLSKIWWNHPPISKNYSSIVHVYNDWYEHYLTAEILDNYKFIIVRYEDILFHTKLLTKDLCLCLKLRSHNKKTMEKWDNVDDIKIYSRAAKLHGKSSNLEEARQKYSNFEYIYEKYTKYDIQYIDKHINHDILHIFDYKIDPSVK